MNGGELGRCRDCSWWRADGEGAHGVTAGDCLLFTLTKRRPVHGEAKLLVTATGTGEAVCHTDADFGCVQFERG